MTAITLIIILGILVFVHELGHFLMAKKWGIRVDEFALGFPPKILSKKVGETEYCLNLIPLGGYVKIYGEDGEPDEKTTQEDKSRIFANKPAWIKVLVLSAGVLGNFLFAWFLLTIGFLNGLPSNNAGIFEDKIQNKKIIIQEVTSSYSAERSGIKIGDEILSISSDDTNKFSSVEKSLNIEKIKKTVEDSKGKKEIKIEIKREDKILDFKLTADIYLPSGKPIIGINMIEIGTLKLPIYLAPIAGLTASWVMTKETASGIFGLIKDSFMGKANWSEVSGPVGIAGMVGKAKAEGFGYLLVLVSLISVNLAVINLIPIPALDGGRILFVIIEKIMKKPIKLEVARIVNATGFILLMALMLIVTFKDILKLIK